jgi:predicted transcriptional regulator
MEHQLNFPDTIRLLPRETVVRLSPTEKDKYYDKVIMDILLANPTGVSAVEIEKRTGFYGRTIREHLKNLSSLGKAYGITRSGVVFYFPSGKEEEKPITISSKTREGLFYVVNKLVNQRGKFYYIQQKEMDEYRTLVVKGGILIPDDDMREFITKLHTYSANKGEK